MGESITDTIIVYVKDDQGAVSSNTVTITIIGSNDIPTLGSYTNIVKEDTAVTSGNLTATGTLTGADVDTTATLTYWTDGTGTSTTGSGTYGNLSLVSSTGAYTYTVDNSLSSIQSLNVGESITDTIIVYVKDDQGAVSSNTVTITINGTNDIPTLGSYTNIVKEDTAVTSGNLTATGTLTGADVDT
ncbi:MAG: VCBS domain-containing protein, partial [Alphaproteobacteria bacterium]